MDLQASQIHGVWTASSNIMRDDRGSFQEWFKYDEVEKATGIKFDVKQANCSISNKDVIRGIHFSLSKKGQSKWVFCLAGRITDVIVDIRIGSPTFGEYTCLDLQAGDGKCILIESGLGHAFLSQEDASVVTYLLSDPYSPIDEFSINPFDKTIGINWQSNKHIFEPILSTRDSTAPALIDLMAEGKLPLYKSHF